MPGEKNHVYVRFTSEIALMIATLIILQTFYEISLIVMCHMEYNVLSSINSNLGLFTQFLLIYLIDIIPSNQKYATFFTIFFVLLK